MPPPRELISGRTHGSELLPRHRPCSPERWRADLATRGSLGRRAKLYEDRGRKQERPRSLPPRAVGRSANARTGPPASQLRLGSAIRGRVAGEAGPSAAAQLCDPLRGTIGRAARFPSNHQMSISLELLTVELVTRRPARREAIMRVVARRGNLIFNGEWV